jgi:2-polyprenyl-6-methoxyphenol hydroxylase-like FAD-dependent oxidoreductase
MGHECVKINATGRSVTVTASHLKEGKYTERNISCNILVGTDGAGSSARKEACWNRSNWEVKKTCKSSSVFIFKQRPWTILAQWETWNVVLYLQYRSYWGPCCSWSLAPQQSLEDFSPEVTFNSFKMDFWTRFFNDLNVFLIVLEHKEKGSKAGSIIRAC